MTACRTAPLAVFLTVTGAAGFLILPVILGGVVARFEFGEAEVGFLASAIMAGAMLAAISALFWVRSANWRTAVRIGLILQATGLIAASLSGSFAALAAAFVCASLGGGAVYSLALTILSDHPSADRLFGVSVAAQVAFQVAGMLLLPYFATETGFGTLMWVLVTLAIAGLAFSALVPERGAVPDSFVLADVFRQHRALLALFGCFFFFFNVGCIWAYIERIGSSTGFTPTELGNALALGVSAGIFGALAAATQGERFGRLSPLLLATIATVISVAFLLPGTGLRTFVAALALYNLAWNYSLTYQYAVVSAADASGRCVAVAPAFHAAGAAVGPAVAATLVQGQGFVAVSFLAAASVVISMLLLLPAARLRSSPN